MKMRKSWSGRQFVDFLHWNVAKHRHEKRLHASKHVILDDDELTENIGKDQSGKEIADMLCNVPPEKLLEVAHNCPASMLQQFVPNVSAAIAPTVFSIPASSSG